MEEGGRHYGIRQHPPPYGAGWPRDGSGEEKGGGATR